MPAGDPAGYLPNVLKSRKRKGQPLYQPKPGFEKFSLHKNTSNNERAGQLFRRVSGKSKNGTPGEFHVYPGGKREFVAASPDRTYKTRKQRDQLMTKVAKAYKSARRSAGVGQG
jgi:hypothetical protein